jgi:hypothetical protein
VRFVWLPDAGQMLAEELHGVLELGELVLERATRRTPVDIRGGFPIDRRSRQARVLVRWNEGGHIHDFVPRLPRLEPFFEEPRGSQLLDRDPFEFAVDTVNEVRIERARVFARKALQEPELAFPLLHLRRHKSSRVQEERLMLEPLVLLVPRNHAAPSPPSAQSFFGSLSLRAVRACEIALNGDPRDSIEGFGTVVGRAPGGHGVHAAALPLGAKVCLLDQVADHPLMAARMGFGIFALVISPATGFLAVVYGGNDDSPTWFVVFGIPALLTIGVGLLARRPGWTIALGAMLSSALSFSFLIALLMYIGSKGLLD